MLTSLQSLLSDTIIDELGRRYYGTQPSRYLVTVLTVCSQLQKILIERGLLPQYEASRWIPGRVKRFSGILEKAERRKIKAKSIEGFELKIGDIAGAKVLLPYWEDVYKLGKLIEKEGMWALCKKVEDYVKDPQKTGYRALHYTIQLDASGFTDLVCEIQLKTVAMDSWAERTHGLIYKEPKAPKVLRNFAKMQADCIYQTDMALQLIKKDILKLRKKRKKGKG